MTSRLPADGGRGAWAGNGPAPRESILLRAIVQKPRYRLVADQIAARIRDGVLPPGSKMPTDRELVDKLGVSRATVREAMIALEMMGYVETRFGSGAYVAQTLPPPSDTDGPPGYFELVEARFHIEARIAGLAAQTCTPEDMTHLRACVAQMIAPDSSFEEIEAADREFHLTLARATGNSVFVSLIEDFWNARRSYPRWTRMHNQQTREDVARYFEAEHMAILRAVEARDSAEAERAMQVHCRNSGLPMLDKWHLQEGEGADPRVLDRLERWKA